MIWAASTKVSFGVKDKWVIAAYCEAKGNDPVGDAAKFKENVGKACFIDGYNKCLNDEQSE